MYVFRNDTSTSIGHPVNAFWKIAFGASHNGTVKPMHIAYPSCTPSFFAWAVRELQERAGRRDPRDRYDDERDRDDGDYYRRPVDRERKRDRAERDHDRRASTHLRQTTG